VLKRQSADILLVVVAFAADNTSVLDNILGLDSHLLGDVEEFPFLHLKAC